MSWVKAGERACYYFMGCKVGSSLIFQLWLVVYVRCAATCSTHVQYVCISGQLTLRACMTTSWASSSPSKILRRVSSSALLRASTFIFSSLRDRGSKREKREGILIEELFQELNKLLGIINGFMWQHVLVHFEGVSEWVEWHRADIGWDSGSHLWPHWAVLRVINRKPLAYLHVKLLRDWGQLPAPFSLHCPLHKVQCVCSKYQQSLANVIVWYTLLMYYPPPPPPTLCALYPVIHRLGPV